MFKLLMCSTVAIIGSSIPVLGGTLTCQQMASTIGLTGTPLTEWLAFCGGTNKPREKVAALPSVNIEQIPTITKNEPRAELREPSDQDLINQAAAKQLSDKKSRRTLAVKKGLKLVAQYGIEWALVSKSNEMTDLQTWKTISDQVSEDKQIHAIVKVSCDVGLQDLHLQASFFDQNDKGVKFLGSDGKTVDVERRIGSEKPEYVILPLLDYTNSIDLRGLTAMNLQATTADNLQRTSRVLYKVRTSTGDMIIKILPFDPNVLPVIQACNAR